MNNLNLANTKKWSAQAPSNIALIKYMGKKDKDRNLSDNPSFSYTLPHLVTEIEIEKIEATEDYWDPLEKQGFYKPVLGPKSTTRFLEHFAFLKNEFSITDTFLIRSANNFPQDCGLASSASSFAALTECAVKAFAELKGEAFPGIQERATLSRMGSGSSCRSFVGPWALWSDDGVSGVSLPLKNLIHMVVVSSGEKKKVSSSQAHEKVSSSLLYKGRTERARIRLGLLMEALTTLNWTNAFEICWSEFWDMHALFETSHPCFGYMKSSTLDVLEMARGIWNKISDGPIVTMDAGPNVHLLFRPEQKSMAGSFKENCESLGHKVLSSPF